MRFIRLIIFILSLSFLNPSSANPFRRFLHQPLFPVSSEPPPDTQPPPPDTIPTPTPDHPFFNENPYGNGQTPDQPPPTPPLAVGEDTGNTSLPHPIAPQPAAKKIAVAISVGMVTLGMLSALAFYVYRHKSKHSGESQKLVGRGRRRGNEDSMAAPSTFLYIGTVDPPRSVSETTNGPPNDSPYHKLGSVKAASEVYRPSPDLQPLPPLGKPQPPPTITSPPAMSSSSSSSDEEKEEGHGFYTPHGSNASIEEGNSISRSKQSHSTDTNSSSVIQQRREARSTSPVPHSKRTSPRSRVSVSSSPDTKHTNSSSSVKMPPSVPPPQPPPRPPLAITYGPRRKKLTAPLPPDMTFLQSVNNQPQQKPKHSVPPPPPPPPPPRPLTIPTQQKMRISPSNAVSTASTQQVAMLESRSLSRKASPRNVEGKPVEEVKINGVEADDADGSKPKLKPLHWDKVRAISDRETVWDHLNSSSFQLNEDMMESLFGCNNSAGSRKKEETQRSAVPPVEKENRVLDPKKSQNIAILLRALNVTRDEVSEALLDGN